MAYGVAWGYLVRYEEGWRHTGALGMDKKQKKIDPQQDKMHYVKKD